MLFRSFEVTYSKESLEPMMLERSHCVLGSFKGVVFIPKKMYQKGLNWVSRAFLSADYDGVSIFDKRNQEYLKKKYLSWITIVKARL